VKEDQRERYSACGNTCRSSSRSSAWARRKSNGIPQNNAQNATELFLQWHAFF